MGKINGPLSFSIMMKGMAPGSRNCTEDFQGICGFDFSNTSPEKFRI